MVIDKNQYFMLLLVNKRTHRLRCFYLEIMMMIIANKKKLKLLLLYSITNYANISSNYFFILICIYNKYRVPMHNHQLMIYVPLNFKLYSFL